jgi:hypothetical protein
MQIEEEEEEERSGPVQISRLEVSAVLSTVFDDAFTSRNSGSVLLISRSLSMLVITPSNQSLILP